MSTDVREEMEIFLEGHWMGIYEEYFLRLKDAVRNVSVLDLLGPMCFAREPLTLDMVLCCWGRTKR